MLEQTQEVCDAFYLACYLGKVCEPCWLLGSQFGGHGNIGLPVFVHFSQFIDEFLDEGNIETLSEQFQNLLKHMQKRRCELFEFQLQ